MAERECRGMTRLVARILVGSMVVTAPGLHPYAAFAQARSFRVQPAVSGIRTTGYASLSQHIHGGIAAGARTGAALKVNLLSPTPGLTPKIQVTPALAAPEAAAQQAPIGGIAASGQLAAAALAAPEMEKQGIAELKSESAKAFDGMKVKPASGNDEVQAGAMGANLAASGLVKSSGSGVRGTRSVPAPSRMQRAAAAAKSYLIRNKTALLVSAGALAVAAIGQALGFNGIGDMSWGLGGLPMAFMGMLGPQDDAFLDELKRSYDPGEIVTDDVAAEIAKGIGQDEAAAPGIMAELAQAGHLMRVADGGYIYVDFALTGETLGDAAGKSTVGMANKNLQSGTAEALAEAVGYFDSADKLFMMTAYKAQTQLLRDNAAVLFLLAVLQDDKKSFRAVLAGLPATDTDARTYHESMLSKLELAISALEKVVFSTDVRSSVSVSATLVRLLQERVEAFVGYCKYGISGHKALSANAESGVKLATALLASLREEVASGPRPGGKVQTEPSAPDQPAPVKKFSAISKTDSNYKKLNEFAVNLTVQAAEGKFPAFIGREPELRQMLKTLMRVEKNNPVVIGDKGVGKTAIVRGLAQLIVDGKIPQLADKNIFQLDLAGLVAGTTLRGQFEERLKGVVDEVKKSKGRVILFIDEIHGINGAGSASGSTDAAQMLKEALSSGEISVIGATTLDEYRKKIESDQALARRFNPIILQPPTQAEAVAILTGVKSRYEEKHGVSILMETVRAVVAMAVRYIKERNLPDSALDLIDDASAEVALKAQAAKDAGEQPVLDVTPDDVAAEVSARTGIPAKQMNADDMDALRRLPAELKERVIGQDSAIAAVTRAIKRGRLGYKKAKKPLGTFLFLGPTGVGKTEVARVLSDKLFRRGEADIVRIDMSEYMDKASVSRMTGSAPGYIGYGEGGQLTEPVRRNPYTVVLFDEVEKAAPEVLDILLQVIEDGRLTDSMGRTVDFSNTIIIMTSNIGAKQGDAAQGAEEEAAAGAESVKRPLGFYTPAAAKTAASQAVGNADAGQRVGAYMSALKAKLRPEFINRIGKSNIIVFNKLTRDDLQGILDLQVAELEKRMSAKEMKVTLTPAAAKHLVDEASSEENLAYGARPLGDAIENAVEEALVEAEFAGTIGKGDTAVVDYVKGRFVVKKG
ncbi:MAG: ATP-dependent Clp protease ATP-binding subunit [Elusimicrobiota bacterium]|jgi:ATP-dependent Clp protease ATP-binding subunit ClpC